MAMVILSREVEEELRTNRKERGVDQHDEVWDGVYVMSPIADNEHQLLVGEVFLVLRLAIGDHGRGMVLPGVNVSDRDNSWEQNFRIPDVALFLEGTAAVNHGTYWRGGPDFAVEITSPGDRTRDKLPFYSHVGVRELLVIDRDPWRLELYRLRDGRLLSVGTSTSARSDSLCSEVVPLTFRLVTGTPRPQIEVVHADGTDRWLI